MPETIPAYVIVARIGAVLSMSLSLAIGLLFLLGGFILPSLAAFAMFVPAMAIMVLAERRAAAGQSE